MGSAVLWLLAALPMASKRLYGILEQQLVSEKVSDRLSFLEVIESVGLAVITQVGLICLKCPCYFLLQGCPACDFCLIRQDEKDLEGTPFGW